MPDHSSPTRICERYGFEGLEGLFEWVKGYYELEAYEKARRKREAWLEPMFAGARQRHGVDRVRLRGLE